MPSANICNTARKSKLYSLQQSCIIPFSKVVLFPSEKLYYSLQQSCIIPISKVVLFPSAKYCSIPRAPLSESHAVTIRVKEKMNTAFFRGFENETRLGWLRNSILKISRNTKFWRNYFEFRENKMVDFCEIFVKFPIDFAKFSRNYK